MKTINGLLFSISFLIFSCKPKQTTEVSVETVSEVKEQNAIELENKKQIITEANINKLDTLQEIKTIFGDLDKDGIEEKVTVYNYNLQDSIHHNRKRWLFVFKQDTHGNWSEWKDSKTVVMGEGDGGMMGDPFWQESFKIKRNTLHITHEGGARAKWNYNHIYRFQNNEFELIGATVNFYTSCEGSRTLDYNVSTGKVLYTQQVWDCDKGTEEITDKIEAKSKLDVLPNFTNFTPGETKFGEKVKGKNLYY